MVCAIGDPALTEISGLVAVGGSFYVVSDASPDPCRVHVFELDSRCKTTPRRFDWPAGQAPVDPEDLATGPDGQIWIADTGDGRADAASSSPRPTIPAAWPT